MRDHIERTIIGVFLLALVALFVVVIAANRNIQSSIASTDWVNHTHAVMREVDTILTGLHRGEAALRNYLITGNQQDQAAYRAAFTDMVRHVEVAKALTRSPAELWQYQKLRKIENAIAKRMQFTRDLVEAAEREGLEGARKQLAAGDGADLLRQIQLEARRLKDQQSVLLRARDQKSYEQAQATKWTVFTGIALNLGLMLFAGWLVRDDLAARRRAAKVLEEANALLEIKVRERTAELAQSNDSLRKENLERRWSNQALQQQLLYSDLIIGSIRELVLVVTTAQNISRANLALLRATQFDSPEIIGGPLAKIFEMPDAPNTGPASTTLATALQQGREIHDAAAFLRRKDGHKLDVRFSLIPLREQNKVVGGVITARVDGAGKHPTG